jgi:eukaryotic-like serine/threonine-protein kinase
MGLLKKGRILESPLSGRRYEIVGSLGEGGFAQAFRAAEIDKKQRVLGEVCLKATKDQGTWHRESYFGELLKENKRVVQMLDSFPVPTAAGGARGMVYCIAFEIAEYGSLSGYLKKNPKPWPAERAKREITALLKALNELHGGSATHRDLTPSNILVCAGGVLKLADFGIASHALAGKPVVADAFNPFFVSGGFVDEERRYWLTVDDVFQMGQLLAMLLLGDAEDRVTLKQVAKLDCEPALKEIIKRSIGPRAQRYADAYEMLEALAGREEGPAGGVKSLKGKNVVFTGPLGMRRLDADVLVLQAGGTVSKDINKDTDVVVQGGRSPHYKGGHKGTKLQRVEKLNKGGAKIRIIGEAEFIRLVNAPKA